jgi:uncharacterized protein YndB with AHSA1/START domain
MSPTPNGRILRTEHGRDLVITRTFRAPIDDVWASVTESERTARWFASWTGEPGPGKTIQTTRTFEGPGAEPKPMTIEACEAPRHLALRSDTPYGVIRLDLALTESDGVTELRFTHHLEEQTDVGSFGPGWEFYLDNLAASRDGTAAPDFNDYYPAQKAYFAEQA